MKASEIIKRGVVKFDNAKSLKGRVFMKGKPTTCMQASVILPDAVTKKAWVRFQFGIDIYPESDMVLTVCERKWHYTVLGLLEEMAKIGRLDSGYCIFVSDDAYDDRTNAPVTNMEFFNGLEELEFDI